MSRRYVPDRNDIVWLDFAPSKGQEIGKYLKFPSLSVISPEAFLQENPP
jgi:mRNA-degrading endonuclease toxin of MazEF toxin-antitoxin module